MLIGKQVLSQLFPFYNHKSVQCYKAKATVTIMMMMVIVIIIIITILIITISNNKPDIIIRDNEKRTFM
jgi:competence protein ComGC